jgi:hypothetical protein
VDPTEVAERAGNSVEVPLSRYAKCVDGRQEIANRKSPGRTMLRRTVRHPANRQRGNAL